MGLLRRTGKPGEERIARHFRGGPQRPTGPNANDQITADTVRLIDHEGNNRGIVDLDEALAAASEAGLDLVEVSPQTDPPVCKILDYGKFKYQAQKKAAESRKHQKTQDVKEIKMRPGIDDHDYDVKMRSVFRFLETGDKVKVTMRFRGREMAHQELGVAVLDRVREQTAELAKVEAMPQLEGRQMTMVLAPK